MAKIYEYIVSQEGIIYRWSKHSGMVEVPKRRPWNGRSLKFRYKGHSISYSHFVAEQLIPNPNKCNLVIHLDGDYFNTHPSNLRWVWTRHKRVLSKQEALEKTTDKRLIEYYSTGNEDIIKNAIVKMSDKFNPNFLGDLYLRIMNYASRNLLFDLETDAIVTYYGLIKQHKLDNGRKIEYNDFANYDSFYNYG